mgnify:CR=1 FL=1
MAFFKVEFIEFRLESSDEKAFTAWYKANSERMDELVADLLADNYKLGLSPDFENQCIIISLTCKAEKHPNSGKCFTSRSDTWEDALWLTLYKHYALSPDGVWPDRKSQRSWG